MSRLCVKGLPPRITEQRLREHFAALGELTDVRIALTRAGASRGFAFIGYKDEAAAARAVSYFNKTFLDTSRLQVELATEIDDKSALQGAWSRHTKAKLAGQKVPAGKKQLADAPLAAPAAATAPAPTEAGGKPMRGLLAAVAAGVKDTAALREFLALSRPAAAAPTWANDDLVSRRPAAAATAASGIVDGAAPAKKASSKRPRKDSAGSSDSEEYQDLPGAAKTSKVASKRARGVSADEDEDDGAETAAKAAKSTTKSDGKGKSTSDMDFLRSKVSRSLDDDEDGNDDMDADGDEAMGEDDAAAAPSIASKRAAKAIAAPVTVVESGGDGVGDTGRLFVRNLPFASTEDEITAHFKR